MPGKAGVGVKCKSNKKARVRVISLAITLTPLALVSLLKGINASVTGITAVDDQLGTRHVFRLV